MATTAHLAQAVILKKVGGLPVALVENTVDQLISHSAGSLSWDPRGSVFASSSGR